MSDVREPLGQLLDAAKIVESLGLPVVATTPDGIIVAWNHAAETLYGHSAASAIGRNVVDLLVPLPLGAAAGRVLKAVSGAETWRGTSS